jgi:heptosyltransferase-2
MKPALPRLDRDQLEPLGVRLCNWVGEVVLMMPTLRRLEDAGYQLHLVGRGWARALLEGTGWSVYKRPNTLLEARRTWRELRRDLGTEHPKALLFTRSLSSALETRLAGWRPIGHSKDGRTPLLSAAYRLSPYTHASRMYWDLASFALGETAPYPTAAHLSPSERQRARALDLLEQHGLQTGQYVVMCPFSGADDREGRKVWPHHGELGARLRNAGIPIVVCPGPGEEDRAEHLLPGAKQLLGTDLGVYAAVLAASRAVVANDTGPGHLAAAVGARLVAIYGPHSVMAWAPLGERVDLHTSPQGWPSLGQIEAALLNR